MAGAVLQFDPESLKPLIAAVVTEVLDQVKADEAKLNGQLVYTEPEAAALLGLRPHQLRDERLKERIQASVGPRGKIMYSRGDLLGYLARRRWEPKG